MSILLPTVAWKEPLLTRLPPQIALNFLLGEPQWSKGGGRGRVSRYDREAMVRARVVCCCATGYWMVRLDMVEGGGENLERNMGVINDFTQGFNWTSNYIHTYLG